MNDLNRAYREHLSIISIKNSTIFKKRRCYEQSTFHDCHRPRLKTSMEHCINTDYFNDIDIDKTKQNRSITR